MRDILQQLQETARYVREQFGAEPETGIILGSGLGNFTAEITIEKELDYAAIPHFPRTTVEGHTGKLILGELSGKKVMAMAGRFHYYEGYTSEQVTYPIRMMKYLGVKNLLISNAAGGVNPVLKIGDLMIITDHMSLNTVNPLIGKNYGELGPRFPDMSEPYDKSIISKAEAAAARLGIPVKQGVYFGVTGPTFETRAEYKMIHILGGDAVGMSTVPEVIAAVHIGIPVFAVSVITDIGLRDEENIITHEEVLHEAQKAEPKLTALFRELIGQL